MTGKCCEHCEDVVKLNHSVFGNGEPEKSIIVRLIGVERRLSRIEKIGWGIMLALLATIGTQMLGWVNVAPPGSTAIQNKSPTIVGHTAMMEP